MDLTSVANGFPKSIADSRQISVDLLLTDIDVAFTFLRTAEISEIPETKSRNVQHATKAYIDISRQLAIMDLTLNAREELDRKLEDLRERLAGYAVFL